MSRSTKIALYTTAAILFAAGHAVAGGPPTHAGQPGGPGAAEDDLCSVLSYFADRVAEVRFNGGAMSDAMELTALIAQGNLAVKTLLQAIVIDAYALPNTGNPRQQRLERQEFSNQIALHCYLSTLE